MITLIIPYYNDPMRLDLILENDLTFDRFERIIIVDDASPDYPAKPIVQDHIEKCCCHRKKIKLYRVAVDYGFNAHGARNLGASICQTEWILFMDVDLELTEEFCDALYEDIEHCSDDEFVLCNLFGDDPGNIFACRRSQFFAAGGYDEELRGWHMGDKIFRERLDRLFKPKLMTTRFACNRKGRNFIKDDECLITQYPDDYTVVGRPQRHIKDKIEYVKARNKEDPKSWKNIPKITFDWRREI